MRDDVEIGAAGMTVVYNEENGMWHVLNAYGPYPSGGYSSREEAEDFMHFLEYFDREMEKDREQEREFEEYFPNIRDARNRAGDAVNRSARECRTQDDLKAHRLATIKWLKELKRIDDLIECGRPEEV